MANLVISAAGAAIGGLVGGQAGMSIGWMLGSYLSAGEDEQQNLTQQTLGDLRVQTSQYGVAIPVVVGTQRVAGNIIWTTEKQPYESRSVQGGGKGGGGQQAEVVTIGYRISMAIALGKGPILGVSRVWQDGKLIVTAPNPMPGVLYLGSNTQTPDATIESYEGAGNVPAYRGLAYMVLTNYDLGQAGRVPIFSFEVLKEGGVNS